MPDLRVEIVRFVDGKTQPGMVEGQFHDAAGKLHSIIDKISMFTTAHLWSDSIYPQPGLIKCRVLERVATAAGIASRISIEPYHFELTDEGSEFLVQDADLCEMRSFIYGGFWDVPRSLTLRYKDRQVLLQSAFDEIRDEYPDVYSVYVVPQPRGDLHELYALEALTRMPLDFLGNIPINRVTFDSSKREQLDASILDQLI